MLYNFLVSWRDVSVKSNKKWRTLERRRLLEFSIGIDGFVDFGGFLRGLVFVTDDGGGGGDERRRLLWRRFGGVGGGLEVSIFKQKI